MDKLIESFFVDMEQAVIENGIHNNAKSRKRILDNYLVLHDYLSENYEIDNKYLEAIEYLFINEKWPRVSLFKNTDNPCFFWQVKLSNYPDDNYHLEPEVFEKVKKLNIHLYFKSCKEAMTALFKSLIE
jgi:hypothetical protein